jgi:hypothetical protein
VRDDRPLIRTRNDLLELIAHALRLQLSYLSKDQALAVADTILRTLKAALIDPAMQIMPAVSTKYKCHRLCHLQGSGAEPMRSAAPDRRLRSGGSDWMPITPKTGSLFHADSQDCVVIKNRGWVKSVNFQYFS